MNIGNHDSEPHEDAAEEPVVQQEPFLTRAERNGRSENGRSAKKVVLLGRHAALESDNEFLRPYSGQPGRHTYAKLSRTALDRLLGDL